MKPFIQGGLGSIILFIILWNIFQLATRQPRQVVVHEKVAVLEGLIFDHHLYKIEDLGRERIVISTKEIPSGKHLVSFEFSLQLTRNKISIENVTNTDETSNPDTERPSSVR